MKLLRIGLTAAAVPIGLGGLGILVVVVIVRDSLRNAGLTR